jgi:hypothetical protein
MTYRIPTKDDVLPGVLKLRMDDLIYSLNRKGAPRCDLCGVQWTEHRAAQEVSVGPFKSWCCWPCSVKATRGRVE